MTNVLKATRATITLGDIELDVFQLPDGSYHFTQSVLKTIQITLSNTSGKKYIKPLLEANSALLQTAQIEGNNVKLKLIPMDLLGDIIGQYAKMGNPFCISILVACFTESLERRADKAFGRVRDEEERNQRLINRRDSILSRHFWTDTIEAYMKRHPELSDNYRRFIYINVSDCINKQMFGLTSKQLREHYDCGDQSPRDWLPGSTLKQIEAIEKATALRVHKLDCDPKQALKDMLNMTGCEPDINLL